MISPAIRSALLNGFPQKLVDELLECHAEQRRNLLLGNLRPNEVVPYTLLEESQILSACNQIGGGKYNRSGAAYEPTRTDFVRQSLYAKGCKRL